MFHVIADGTGAYTFIETLITNYFIEKHQLDRSHFLPQTSSIGEKSEDAFSRYYTKKSSMKYPRGGTMFKDPDQIDTESGGIMKWIKALLTGKAYRLTGQMDDNMEGAAREGYASVYFD